MMVKLENCYSGDENWDNFVSFYSTKLHDVDDSIYEKLKELLGGQTDLATVVAGIFRADTGVEWVKSKPKILEGLSPIDCLNEDNLIKRLRVVLMRMPV